MDLQTIIFPCNDEQDLERLQNLLQGERQLRQAAETRAEERKVEAQAAAELAEILSEESELLRVRLASYEQQISQLQHAAQSAEARAKQAATPRSLYTPRSHSTPRQHIPTYQITPATKASPVPPSDTLAYSPLPPRPSQRASSPSPTPDRASATMCSSQPEQHTGMTGNLQPQGDEQHTHLQAGAALSPCPSLQIGPPNSSAVTPRVMRTGSEGGVGTRPESLHRSNSFANLVSQLQAALSEAATYKARVETLEGELAAAASALAAAHKDQLKSTDRGAAAAAASDATYSKPLHSISPRDGTSPCSASLQPSPLAQPHATVEASAACPAQLEALVRGPLSATPVPPLHLSTSVPGAEQLVEKLSVVPKHRGDRVAALVAALKAAGAVAVEPCLPCIHSQGDDRVAMQERDQD